MFYTDFDTVLDFLITRLVNKIKIHLIITRSKRVNESLDGDHHYPSTSAEPEELLICCHLETLDLKSRELAGYEFFPNNNIVKESPFRTRLDIHLQWHMVLTHIMRMSNSFWVTEGLPNISTSTM